MAAFSPVGHRAVGDAGRAAKPLVTAPGKICQSHDRRGDFRGLLQPQCADQKVGWKWGSRYPPRDMVDSVASGRIAAGAFVATAIAVLGARQVAQSFRGSRFKGSGLRFNPNRSRLKNQTNWPALVGKVSVSSTDVALFGPACGPGQRRKITLNPEP